MKKILVPTLLASAIATLAPVVQAQESTLSYNVGVVSDYRYRGLSQSRLQPALQGGIDYADKSGFYVGAWGSTIKWIKDAGGDAPVEIDVYAGYKGAVGDVGYDVGFLRYEYTRNKLTPNANTNEIYGALTYGVFTAKYSHALTNLFGAADSKGAYYLDLSANLDMGGGYTLTPHVGRQGNFSGAYNDYSVTLAKDLGNGLTGSLTLVDTNITSMSAGKNIAKSGAVVGLKYSF